MQSDAADEIEAQAAMTVVRGWRNMRAQEKAIPQSAIPAEQMRQLLREWEETERG